MQNMTIKKKIIYIAIAVALVAIIAISTVLILQSINNKKTDTTQNQTPTVTANETNAAQKTEAIQLLHSDPAKAKEILTQLRQKYKDLGDTNSVTDVEAQLFLLDNPKTTK